MKRIITKSVASIVVCLIFASVTAHADIKLLQVMISDYLGDENDLNAPIEDSILFAKELERFGKVDIRRVVDHQATRSAIISAFESHLIRGCSPDDVAVFFFSGHGSLAPDLSGDEKDKYDEVLCAYNYNERLPSTFILDDHLGMLLKRCPAKSVVVVFDCCHSGTATRSFDRVEWNMGKGIELESAQTFAENDALPSHFFISACGASEVGIVISNHQGLGRDCSAFLYSLVQAIQAAEPLSLSPASLESDLQNRVNSLLQEYGKSNSQTPQVECEDQSVNLGGVLSGRYHLNPATSPPRAVSVSEQDDFTSNSEDSAFSNSTNGIAVTVSTDKLHYVRTEHLKVSVTVDKASYVRICYADYKGDLWQIYPLSVDPIRKIQPGERLHLPTNPSRALRLGMDEDVKGPILEGIIAIASNQPFTDVEGGSPSQKSYFQLGKESVSGVLTRGIEVESFNSSEENAADIPLRPQFGQALTLFRLTRK